MPCDSSLESTIRELANDVEGNPSQVTHQVRNPPIAITCRFNVSSLLKTLYIYDVITNFS